MIFGSEMSHNCTKFTRILVFIFYFSTQSTKLKTFYNKHNQICCRSLWERFSAVAFSYEKRSFKLAKLSHILRLKSGQNDTRLKSRKRGPQEKFVTDVVLIGCL